LISNALKHAFPAEGAAEGTIAVDIHPSEDDQIVLIVSDNGVGLPQDVDLELSTSLGLRLVRMLIQQLRGTVELDRRAGTSFRFTFSGVT
jgi:two-component sensor histidine kinase